MDNNVRNIIPDNLSFLLCLKQHNIAKIDDIFTIGKYFNLIYNDCNIVTMSISLYWVRKIYSMQNVLVCYDIIFKEKYNNITPLLITTCIGKKILHP